LAAPRWLPILGLTTQLQTAEKAVFVYRMQKKKSAVFPSKVETLLLSKNLTYKNFVSVAL